MLLKFKASMSLLAKLTFRKGRFLVSVGTPTLTALNSLMEEISKMILNIEKICVHTVSPLSPILMFSDF